MRNRASDCRSESSLRSGSWCGPASTGSERALTGIGAGDVEHVRGRSSGVPGTRRLGISWSAVDDGADLRVGATGSDRLDEGEAQGLAGHGPWHRLLPARTRVRRGPRGGSTPRQAWWRWTLRRQKPCRWARWGRGRQVAVVAIAREAGVGVAIDRAVKRRGGGRRGKRRGRLGDEGSSAAERFGFAGWQAVRSEAEAAGERSNRASRGRGRRGRERRRWRPARSPRGSRSARRGRARVRRSVRHPRRGARRRRGSPQPSVPVWRGRGAEAAIGAHDNGSGTEGSRRRRGRDQRGS